MSMTDDAKKAVKKKGKEAVKYDASLLHFLEVGINPLDVHDKPRWSEIDPDLITKTVADVTEAGAMVTFSRTRSGKSLGLSIFADGSPMRVYADTPEEMEGYLVAVQDAVNKQFEARQK
jgi:hypothetical protein